MDNVTIYWPSFWIGFGSGIVALLLIMGTISLIAMGYAFLYDDSRFEIQDKLEPDEHEVVV